MTAWNMEFDPPEPAQIPQMLYEVKTHGKSIGIFAFKTPENPTSKQGFTTLSLRCRLVRRGQETMLENVNDNALYIRAMRKRALFCQDRIAEARTKPDKPVDYSDGKKGKDAKKKAEKKAKQAGKKLKDKIQKLEDEIKQCTHIIDLLGGAIIENEE